MLYGDPESCRLEIRHADGRVDVRPWPPDDWPPQIGALVRDDEGSYRVAAIRREGVVTVVVALPVEGGVRRVGGREP